MSLPFDDTIDELFKSAKNQDLSTIKDFARFHMVDLVTVRNRNKQTLLHQAAGFGRTNLSSELIAQGADVNVQDIEGEAPLHNACCHGHLTISKMLIQAGATVDLTDAKGWSPLHFALSRKYNAQKINPLYFKVIKLLIESGADPYLKSHSNRDCLSRIKDSEDRRSIRVMYLLHRLQECNPDDIKSRRELTDKYLSITDFFELVKLGDESVFKLLLTPRLLNSRLATCDDITPLHRAAGYNHLDAAKLFLQNGASVDATDSFGRIPLHNAAQYGHGEMIEILVRFRSDINKQDNVGYSPLHVAASNRTFTACLKLIELGADIKAKCNEGKLPYELAESDDVREVLKPDDLSQNLQVIPSSSDQGIYLEISRKDFIYSRPSNRENLFTSDELMLDSNSNRRLFTSNNHTIKKVKLDEKDPRYQQVKTRMMSTIVIHNSESGGLYSSYEIMSIELILHEKVWYKYRLMCQRLEIDYGPGSKNEKILFHGSNFIDNIQSNGFDERYAQRNGMFGAGIYFASHSSKSNQYTFGWGQGCREHMDKSCFKCERKMIYSQVALGRSLVSKEAMPDCAHAPPGYSSVTGTPESTDGLVYPEYVIYSGDQAYPLFVIRYRIVP